jgi:ribonuclease HI
MSLTLYVDGGSRGNPGPAGAGVVIRDERRGLVHEGAYFVGRQTNNAAEYLALIKGLERAARAAPDGLTIISDSELLVRQLTGEYRVKSPKLAPLHAEAEALLVRLGRWTARHVPREQNARADALANLAMDRRADVVVFDVDSQSAAPQPGPATAAPPTAPPDAQPGGGAHVRVMVSTPPNERDCPAGAWASGPFVIGATCPPGVCVHAAHTLLPTVLAIQAIPRDDVPIVPTMTLRCSRNGCSAVFRVCAERSGNGPSHL